MSVDGPARSDSVDTPLWRAAAVYRLVAAVYAVGFQLVVQDEYHSLRGSWLVVGIAVSWSGAAALGTLSSTWRRAVVAADQVVTLVLIGGTVFVADSAWRQDHQVTPTTIWVAGAVVTAAVYGGPRAGCASAVLMSGAIAVVRGTVDADLWRDSTGPILVSVGLTLGLASRTARQARRRLDDAVALAAATAERERLAREVHDGVLQVLAMVKRRGHEIGGETAELAELAGRQESALRALLSTSGERRRDGSVDLTAALRSAVGPDVTVSAPSGAVVLAAEPAAEITAAALAAVDNTRRHAGSDASTFLLIEDLGDAVVVTVRDDGPGIPAGRLEEARTEGRLGVSASIIGRMEALGGHARLDSAPGEGTEWELTMPIPR